MVKTTDLVAALRCSSQAPTPSPPCTTCAYRVVELLDGKEYTSCDCDRMGLDAADRLEELVDRCARYAEEIAVLRRLKVETGSLACMGCGYEHNCGIHGCAILRKTIAWLEKTLAEDKTRSVMEYRDER